MTDFELETDEPTEVEVSTRENSPTYRCEETLADLIDIVETARTVPMSASVMINRDEVLDLLDDAVAHLPEEFRSARWLLKERDEVMEKAQADAAEVMADAKSNAARLVQRQEVVKAADHRAREIVDAAQAESRRMRHETEDFCDQRLASFENILDRLTKTVTSGRRKLATTIEESELAASAVSGVYEDDDGSDASTFFDQEIE